MRTATTLLLAASATFAGCATYLEARDNVKPGGLIDQQKAAANADLQAERDRNAALQDAKLQRERELDRQDKRIRALQADAKKQDDALAAARKANRISQAKYAQMKKDLDTVRSETQDLEMQNRGDRVAAPSAASSDADKAKEKRLGDLERRKKELEDALAAMTKG